MRRRASDASTRRARAFAPVQELVARARPRTCALVAAVPSVFWGLLFARQRSLLGVSVSHVLLGWFAVYVLGVPGVR